MKQQSSPSSSLTSAAPTQPTSAATPATRTTASSTTSPSAINSSPLSTFSGRSFAAGFVPGMLVGLLFTVLIVFILLLRRRNKSTSSGASSPNSSWLQRKGHSRHSSDTLGPVGPMAQHSRNVSDPSPHPQYGNRTDFLRSPPRGLEAEETYSVSITSPTFAKIKGNREPRTPLNQTAGGGARVRSLFARSPLTAPRRGTISPIRQMRQKHAKRNSGRPEQVERSESSETIDVLMPASTQAPESHGSQGDTSQYGQATFDEPYTHGALGQQPQNQRYYQQQQQQQPQSTPTPIAPRNGSNRAYPTYLSYGPDLALAPPNAPWIPSPPPAGSPGRAGGKRDTTFSSMMEKAGLRRSDFSPVGSGSPGAKGKGKGGQT
ncbi:hypothetical protein B0A49_08267 [Cryomyces minteri]|uniref:Uncharacterized protein n=1 Tax=Cryomyces minteri TaxID=331657 RepID=A0A4U0WHM7_9PEZI|nr:hypothetical protein B0A49_08267 [Cryomyces minteri]